MSKQLSAPKKPKSLERYGYLNSECASRFALRLQSFLDNVWGLIALGVTLSLVGGAITVAWCALFPAKHTPYSGLVAIRQGSVLFTSVIVVATLALILVAPFMAAVTFAGSWSREVNQRVQRSPKSAYKFIARGFTSTVLRAFFMVLTAIPLEIVAFTPYGISATNAKTLLLEQVLLLTTASTFSAIGLYFSLRTSSWSRWAARTYFTVLLVVVGPILLGFPLEMLLRPMFISLSEYQQALLIWFALPMLVNPFVSALATTDPTLNIWRTLYADTNRRVMMPPFWLIYTVGCLIVTPILLLVTVHRLRRHVVEDQAQGKQ